MDEKSNAKIPELPVLKEIPEPQTNETQPKTTKLNTLTENEGRLLEALILQDVHKKPEMSLALMHDLLKDPSLETEARYHMALAARSLKLNTEFRYQMSLVAQNKSKDWRKEAAQAFAQNVDALEITDMKVVDALVTEYEVDTTQNDAYQYFRAKYYLEEGNLGQVEDALSLIPKTSPYYAEGLLISALYNYRRGKIDSSVRELEEMLNANKLTDSLRPIAAITLARIHFQRNEYKEALETYHKVDKTHYLWLQAMIEQSWTQILLQDYEGAAGNMFTLHTDFFKNAYAPESYVVRAVGYLNLCQYGDGAQVLNGLKRKYGHLMERLDKFQSSKKKNMDYYETVKMWLKNSDLKEVEGLPRSFIVELARHPGFVKFQSQINNFEDEMENFNKINLAIIQLEKELVKRETDLREDSAKLRSRKSESDNVQAQLKIDIEDVEKKLTLIKMQKSNANRARGLLKAARESMLARIDKEKVALREKAAAALKGQFSTLKTNLASILEQNDVLQYEVLAGAGEHIRYQMAGGNVKDEKAPDHDREKNVKWKFQGEIWEDEVGHFRSSLKNVCAKDDNAKAESK